MPSLEELKNHREQKYGVIVIKKLEWNAIIKVLEAARETLKDVAYVDVENQIKLGLALAKLEKLE